MLRHPDRVLPLQGASNFRDLGGYPGRDGRPLRWRRLFRSDHLGELTAADRATLRSLELGLALDFRGEQERAAAPYDLPGIEQRSLSIEPTVAQRMHELATDGRPISASTAAALMRDLYRTLVNDQAGRYAEFFDQLLGAETPLVFHCTAGKDRTGFAAALALLALGVPRPLVMQDYLLTNELFRPPPVAPDHPLAEALGVLWRVEQHFLDTALQVVDADHGGVEHYLAHRLGLSPAALRALADLYLQRDAAPGHDLTRA